MRSENSCYLAIIVQFLSWSSKKVDSTVKLNRGAAERLVNHDAPTHSKLDGRQARKLGQMHAGIDFH